MQQEDEEPNCVYLSCLRYFLFSPYKLPSTNYIASSFKPIDHQMTTTIHIHLVCSIFIFLLTMIL